MHGSMPAAHILQVSPGLVSHRKKDSSESVEYEGLCMNLLAEFGLPVPRIALLTFCSQTVLGVERFDRRPRPSCRSAVRALELTPIFCLVFSLLFLA